VTLLVERGRAQYLIVREGAHDTLASLNHCQPLGPTTLTIPMPTNPGNATGGDFRLQPFCGLRVETGSRVVYNISAGGNFSWGCGRFVGPKFGCMAFYIHQLLGRPWHWSRWSELENAGTGGCGAGYLCRL
jgi:hypothetical protein